MDAEIITIGDELLIGQVINTNQAYIAEQLNSVGISIRRMTTVGDDLETILHACEQAWNSHEIVIATGGLGPTHDDITKTALCRFFATDLVPNRLEAEDTAGIKVVSVDPKSLEGLITSAAICDAKSIAGLYTYLRTRS